MTDQRRTGVTRQLVQAFEDNRGRVLTIERLAELVSYDPANTSTLVRQMMRQHPELNIECPVKGSYVYRGLHGETRSSSATGANETPVRPNRVGSVTSPAIGVGDVCEVIGLSQDGTPIVRDGNGALYLLRRL